MEQTLQRTVALLGRTPASLNAFLRELPDSLTRQNEGATRGAPTTSSATSSTPSAPIGCRVKMILEFGETRAFEKFDRLGQVRRARANRWRNCWMNLFLSALRT
jgi:hypothetical protein